MHQLSDILPGHSASPADQRSALSEWTLLLVATVARAALYVVIGMLLWSVLPAVWGWVPTTVMSDSMAPRIRTGDVVVAMPADPAALRTGQVLLVEDPDHAGRLRLHRFVGPTDDGLLLLKGDANATNDSTAVSTDAVVGIAVLRSPLAGTVGVWVAQGRWILVAGAAAALFSLIGLSRVDRQLRADARGDTTVDLTVADGDAEKRRLSLIVTATAGLVAALVIALALADGASAAYTAKAVSPATSLRAATGYSCLNPTPTDTPYLFYNYSERTGTSTTDRSGNARTGTLANVTRTPGACVANGSPAITLNGTSSSVSTPATAIAGPTAFTVETWFRTTTTRGGKLIGFGDSRTGISTSFDRHVYMANDGRLVFGVRPGGTITTVTSAAAYNDGAWHHVAATLGSTGMRLYVDGVEVASNAGTTTALTIASGYWKFGVDNLDGWPLIPTSRFFAGTIDNTAVYTAALTATRVAAHVSAGH